MKKLWLSLALGLSLSLFTGTAATAQNANNFVINSFDATYSLSKDEQDRSRLKITEEIKAQFPDYNQNHGIERALPKKYDSHTLRLKIESVKDQNGKNINYETSSQNNNEVLRIGDPDKYVHGEQTYVITYAYHDVIKILGSHDEFRWNTNGLEWNQPFLSLKAAVELSPELAQEVTNKACYYGSAGSTQSCEIKGNEFRAPNTLGVGQNLTFRMDFNSGTFAGYKDPAVVAFVKKFQHVIVGILAACLLAMMLIGYRTVHRFTKPIGDKRIIVPEYLPPKQVSVLTSAVIIGKPVGIASTSQILDLAVRHYIKIYELEAKGIFNKKPTYKLELTKNPMDLLPDEQDFVKNLFEQSQAGATVSLDSKNTKLSSHLQKSFSSVQKSTHKSGYYVHTNNKKPYYLAFTLAIIVSAVISVSGLLINDYAEAQSTVIAGMGSTGALIAVVCLFLIASTKQLSADGTSLRNYIQGLRHYMEIAEAERLKVLQSPQGAIKTPVKTDDKAQLVKLYEKVLPYAVLLGIEKDWAKQMELYYTDVTTPDWYSGNGVFYAAAFASSISSFSSSVNSYSSPSSSSGRSGSGSGGGGGGGGGW